MLIGMSEREVKWAKGNAMHIVTIYPTAVVLFFFYIESAIWKMNGTSKRAVSVYGVHAIQYKLGIYVFI